MFRMFFLLFPCQRQLEIIQKDQIDITKPKWRRRKTKMMKFWRIRWDETQVQEYNN